MVKAGYDTVTVRENIIPMLEKLKIKAYDSLCDVIERLLKEKSGKLGFDMVRPVLSYPIVKTMIYRPGKVKLSYDVFNTSIV